MSAPGADLAAIRQRAEQATPGPWRWEDRELLPLRGQAIADDGSAGGEYNEKIDVHGADAAFIAHAREDIPFLLKQWDTRESALRALVAQLDEYDRIDQCSPATPWCDAPSYMNSDHYDGHPEPKRQRIKAIRDAVERLL